MTPEAQALAEQQGIAAKAEATSALELIQAQPCETPEQAQWLIDAGRMAAKQKKAYESQRDDLAKPVYRSYKAIRDFFAPPIGILDQIIAYTKTTTQAFYVEQQRIAQQGLQEATTREEVTQAVAAIAPKPTGAHTRRDLDFEIEDESKVPREYWVIDRTKVMAALREKRAVPGIKPVHKEVVVYR